MSSKCNHLSLVLENISECTRKDDMKTIRKQTIIHLCRVFGKTYGHKTLQNFLSFVAFTKVCLFDNPPHPCPAKHLHKPVPFHCSSCFQHAQGKSNSPSRLSALCILGRSFHSFTF